jgi:hypothetical protein
VRTADPWRDTDVIDERAPRFNQAVTGTVAVPLLKLDVGDRPELARKYGVAVVPTVLKVASDGAVLSGSRPD